MLPFNFHIPDIIIVRSITGSFDCKYLLQRMLTDYHLMQQNESPVPLLIRMDIASSFIMLIYQKNLLYFESYEQVSYYFGDILPKVTHLDKIPYPKTITTLEIDFVVDATINYYASCSLCSYFFVNLDRDFKRYIHISQSTLDNLNLNRARTCLRLYYMVKKLKTSITIIFKFVS